MAGLSRLVALEMALEAGGIFLPRALLLVDALADSASIRLSQPNGQAGGGGRQETPPSGVPGAIWAVHAESLIQIYDKADEAVKHRAARASSIRTPGGDATEEGETEETLLAGTNEESTSDGMSAEEVAQLEAVAKGALARLELAAMAHTTAGSRGGLEGV
jgi:hypothetical protein